MEKLQGFKWRGMFTFLVVLALLVDAVSGIILYITPPGRIIRWTGWTLWGLNKGDWQAIHTVFSFLLLLGILGHLYFNWRVLVHFFWSKMQSALNLKLELAAASLIILVVLIGILWNVPPFKSVMTFGRNMKLGWAPGNAPFTGLGPNFDGTRGRARDFSAAKPSWDGEQISMSRTLHTEAANYGGERRGFGRRALDRNPSMHSDEIPSRVSRKGFKGPGYSPTPEDHSGSSRFKGRDIVRLGRPTSLTGILGRQGDEWTLCARDIVYEIHLGPSEFRDQQGFLLTEGQKAMVKGFLYGTDMAVTAMETGGKSILLRNESGRAAWAGTKYSRASGHGRD